MSYMTYYSGGFTVTPKLKTKHAKFLYYWFSQSKLDPKKNFGGAAAWVCPVSLPLKDQLKFCESCDATISCSIQNISPLSIACKKKNSLDLNEIKKIKTTFADGPHNYYDPYMLLGINSDHMIKVGFQGGTWENKTLNVDNDLKNTSTDTVCSWLCFVIEKFFKPLGYVLNGEVEASGEERDDNSRIIIENNKVICEELELTVKKSESVEFYSCFQSEDKITFKKRLNSRQGWRRAYIMDPVPPINNELINSILSGKPYMTGDLNYTPTDPEIYLPDFSKDGDKDGE